MLIQRVTIETPIYVLPGEELSIRVVSSSRCVVTITRDGVSVSTEMDCTTAKIEHGEWVTS